MRLDDQRRSENIEDRRGQRGPRGGGGVGLNVGRFGIPGLIIVGLLMLFFPQAAPLVASLLGVGGGGPQVQQQQGQVGSPDDAVGDQIAAQLGSIEDVWTKLFAEGRMAAYKVPAGTAYPSPTLVLFEGAVASACGNASSASGPFYCPADSKMYLDTSFFADLKNRFGAPGDFAQAYVIAHEAGHHIQNLLGIAEQVQGLRGRVSQTEFNQYMVMMELQADCFAGVWGHFADTWKGQLEPGDLEEALNAANAIGDDRLQKQSKGYVVPDSFTHGTSEQRMRWFKRGFDGGDPAQCDTFSARTL
jgi:predicted metalloprotease